MGFVLNGAAGQHSALTAAECKMFGLVERARLLRHEKTFKRAAGYAMRSERDAELLALSMCGAALWLAEVSSGSIVGVRSALSGLGPSRWRYTRAALLRAAQDATSEGNAARYLTFALLAGVIDSRIIELGRPSVAARATAFRDRAVAFADDLTNTALRWVGPNLDANPDRADERLGDCAPVLPSLAEQRFEAEAGARA